MRRSVLVIVLLAPSLWSAAQTADGIPSKRVHSLVKKGDASFAKRDLSDAKGFYERADALAPGNAQVELKLGLCALDGPQPATSLPWFEKAVILDPVLPLVHYRLGQAYQLNACWDQAIAEFKQHLEIIRRTPDADRTFNMAEKHILECTYGKSFMADPVNARVVSAGAGINSAFADHGVHLVPNSGMLFTSARGGRGKGASHASRETIYSSRWTAEGWSRPVAFPAGMDSNADSCAFRTGDGRWLYFVSDRKGGLGGSDIYRSAWDSTTAVWGTAENLGPVINTAYDEDRVFLSSDGQTLYFASEGHTSMGGLDLFKSTLVNGTWSRPENLGWPINSPADDRDLVISADGTSGYFSSSRAGGMGDEDIYRVDLPQGRQADATAMLASSGNAVPMAEGEQRMRLIGFIKGLRMMDPVEAHIELMDLGDTTFTERFTSDPVTGEFTADVPAGREYAMHVTANGFLLHTDHVGSDVASGDVRMDVGLTTSDAGNTEVMRNILFDSNSCTLEPSSTGDLRKLLEYLQGDPSLRIEIGGHTDSDTGPMPNQELSEERAKAVLDWLVDHGIAPDRLVAKGYGAGDPIAPNDSGPHMALNRRTEIKVL